MYVERRCVCSELLRIRRELVGRPVRCPSCKQVSVWADKRQKTASGGAPGRNPLEDPSALAAAIVAAIKRNQ